jgi:hypothetical protein
VRYDTAQTLTTAEKYQARSNIYAAPFEAWAYSGLQINGAMEVSQERGRLNLALINNSGAFVLDLWSAVYSHAAATAVFQAAQVAHGDAAFQMMPDCIVMRATTAMAAVGINDFAMIYTQFEGYRISRLAFGTSQAAPFTLGFWVKTSIPGTMTLIAGDVAFSRCYLVDIPITAANVFEYKTITIPGDTGGTWQKTFANSLYIKMAFACGTNLQATPGGWGTGDKRGTVNTTNFFASANNQVQVTGFSFFAGPIGPTAAQSTIIQRTFDEEAVMCCRYYQKSYPYTVNIGAITDAGKTLMMWPGGGGYHAWPIIFATRMRTAPSVVTAYSPTSGTPHRLRDDTNGADRNASYAAASNTGFSVYTDLGGTPCSSLACHWSADARDIPTSVLLDQEPSLSQPLNQEPLQRQAG